MTTLEELTEPWATLDPARWEVVLDSWSTTPDPTDVAASAGRLTLRPRRGYVRATSVAAYDLTGAALTVELVTVPTIHEQGGSVETNLQLVDAAALAAYNNGLGDDTLQVQALGWSWTVDGLRPYHREPGTGEGPVNVELTPPMPYDSTMHRWLQIIERDGVVSWRTSPDGATWTTHAVWAATVPLDALRVDLVAGYWGDTEEIAPGPGVAVYGAVNPPPPANLDPGTIIAGNGVPNVAVDVIPELDPGTFQVDVDEVDGLALLGWPGAAESAWVNIVCDVMAVSITRGSSRVQGVLTRAEAGQCTVTLRDTLRRFDPLANADAIHSGTPMRVRAWGYDTAGERWDAVLFTGTIYDLPVIYPLDGAPQVTVTASDRIAELAAWASAGRPEPGAGAGDNLLARVERTATEMGLPGDAISYDVDRVGYAVTHPPVPLARPWDELTEAQDAELGRVWVDASNRLVVRSRGSELSGPVRGTFSDVHGDADPGTSHCCILDGGLVATLGTDQTINRAIGARRVPGGGAGGAVVQVDDTLSAARWGWHVTERRSLEVQTDAQALTWARYLMAHQAVPQLRVDSIAPAPSPVDLDSALEAWQAVCATDLGDRWAVRYRPQLGAMVDRTVGVLGIAHTISPDAGWGVSFTTLDAPDVTEGNPTGYFLLDVSEVDSGDVLSPTVARRFSTSSHWGAQGI